MNSGFQIKVVSSKDKTNILMSYVEPLSASMTVNEFKIKVCKESDALSKAHQPALTNF